ncbi:acyltransferase [Roseateles sp. BYS180W]|uniref:Acyltransferase n=1 Tax=Roseateles rivi TaxID=3299028 RepID=A0ABW7FQU8_9BURK
MQESTFVLGIWLLYALYRMAGRRVFRAVMWPVVLVHWLCRPALRSSSMGYLQRLHRFAPERMPQPGAWSSLRHAALFADTMLDKLLAMGGRYPAARVRCEGHEAAIAHLQQGRGMVLATAHTGCLELCRVLAQRVPDLRLHVLVHTRHAQAFNRILERLQPQAQQSWVRLIEVTEITPALAQELSERVEAGDCVAIAADRVPVNSQRVLQASFLGESAAFPMGPYVLAALLKCPLFYMSCLHEGQGYAVRFELLAPSVQLSRQAREASMQPYLQAYVSALERSVLSSPLDWFNFYDFWAQRHGTP